jgi:carbamoyl-phosphate synthase large subunit
MAGKNKLADFSLPNVLHVPQIFVKSPVFPFKKFAGVDPILGPEMHSTGEVMGVGSTFGEAYGKAMEGAGLILPMPEENADEGVRVPKAFISVTNADKGQAVILARRLNKLGFDLVATYGTAIRLREVGLECESVFKVNEGRPNIADLIRQGDIALIINTPLGKVSHYDEKAIRKAALQFNVPCVTTITGAEALVESISTKLSQEHVTVRSLQEIHDLKEKTTAQA